MSQQSRERSVTRERLIGMQVVDGDGYLVGTVKDISFMIGRMGISLYVEGKDGVAKEVAWEDVQAVGDFVLLKPRPTQAVGVQPTQPVQPEAQVQTPICPVCKGRLTWIPQYQRWYCYKCKKYL
ncbi:MAG: PRC-barrel domain-containing protein [Candidatus Bathyarchaeia archaeon]